MTAKPFEKFEKNMKRILLLVMFAGLMYPAGCYAQKVYKDGNKVILDLSVASGMPAEVVTNQPKYTAFTPKADALGANNGHDGSINATVFQKLEVAPKDMNKAGAMDNTGGSMDWVTAFNGCKNLSYNGEGWRLPTQRELQLIYIFKPAIEDIFDEIDETPFTNKYYWSSTEYENGATNSWVVRFADGSTSYTTKTGSHYVRCVREVTD